MGRGAWGVRKAIRIVASAVLALMPVFAYALGLGPMKVNSALNEPLNAEIEFTSVTRKEIKTLEAGLAPRSAFTVADIDRPAHLTGIKFTVAKRLDGRYFLQLTTDYPYKEPFLHLLVQVEWAMGRLRREYTALIDPPYLTAAKPSGIKAPRIEPLPPLAEGEPFSEPPLEPEPLAKALPEPEPPVKTKKPVAEKTPTAPKPVDEIEAEVLGAPLLEFEEPKELVEIAEPLEPELFEVEAAIDADELYGPTHIVPTSAPSWANIDSYRVTRGDTLYDIARMIRRDKSLSTEQVVLALFDANPKAFFDNNTSNLKAGKILHVPERAVVVKRSRSNARKEFFAQYDVWQEYKLKLASTSRPPVILETKMPATPEGAKKPPAAKKPAVAGKPAKPKTKPKKVVTAKKKVEKKSERGMKIPASKSPRKEELLKIVRSNLEAKKPAKEGGKLAETESVTGEKQILAERATTLEESIASKKMETEKLGDRVGKAKETAESTTRLIELENASLAQEQKAAVKATKPSKPEPAAKVESAKKPLEVAKAPAKPRRRVSTPPPEKEDIMATVMGVVDELLADQFMVMLVGGVVVLVGAFGIIYMRRRSRSLAEFEESILSTSDIASGELSTGSEDAVAESSDTSFLSDFSQGGMGNITTDEVDPIAEADVYLAYGRDEQAEEILRDAVVKHPARHELKEKLLEIYSQRNDTAAFETVAEELYASLGGKGDELWDRVAEMGRKLNAENPMFQGGRPAPAAEPITAPPFDETQGLELTQAGAGAPALAETQAIDLAQMQAEAVAPEFAEPVVDMDIEAEVLAAPEPGAGEIDFNLDLEAVEAEAPEPGGDSVIEFEDAGESEVVLEDVDTGVSIDAEAGLKLDTGVAVVEPGGDELAMELDAEAAVPEVALAPEMEPAPASAEIDVSEQWDEAATKLDLAKAYIDMGDAEGARSILEEVESEGSEEQKRQAAELVAQIA